MRFSEALRTASIMLVLSAAAIATADDADKETELGTVVVTASQTEEPIENVGSTVTVIGAAEIEKSGASSMLEVLRRIPGVIVSQSGGPGAITSVFIRGSNSQHTLVLIDGVRANSLTSGTFNFSSISVANIERIEVLRGPQSSMYGSDAMGGVINIITKRGKKGVSGSASYEAGNHKFQRGTISLRGGAGRLSFSTALDYEETDGWSSAWDPAGNRDDDSFERLNFSQTIGLKLIDAGYAEILYRHSDSEYDTDTFAAIDGKNRYSRSEEHYGQFSLSQPITEWLIPSTRVGFGSTNLNGTGTDPTQDFDLWSDNVLFELKTEVNPSNSYSLIMGYIYEDRKGESKGSYQDFSALPALVYIPYSYFEKYHTHSGFLENKFNIADAFFLNLAARHDDLDEYGSEDTYRGSFAYVIDKTSTRIHGSYGTGFRAPTFNDIYWPNDGFVAGNPNLVPETSRGYDIGIEQSIANGDIVADVTFFRNEYEDLIYWAFNTTTFLFQPTNLSNAVTKGVETTVKWQAMDSLGISASHTYTDTEDKSNGQRLGRRPLNQYTLGLDFAAKKFSGTLAMVAVRDRVETNDTDMDDYERWDLSLNYQATEHIRPFIRIQNLFDANYEEVTGYTSPGINGSAGVVVTF